MSSSSSILPWNRQGASQAVANYAATLAIPAMVVRVVLNGSGALVTGSVFGSSVKTVASSGTAANTITFTRSAAGTYTLVDNSPAASGANFPTGTNFLNRCSVVVTGSGSTTTSYFSQVSTTAGGCQVVIANAAGTALDLSGGCNICVFVY